MCLAKFSPSTSVLAVTSVRRWTCPTSASGSSVALATTRPPTRPVSDPRPYIPEPTPVKAVGIDGGYIRLAGRKSRRDGWFEVMVGKSQREDKPGGCFAYVHRLEPDPAARMLRLSQPRADPTRSARDLSIGWWRHRSPGTIRIQHVRRVHLGLVSHRHAFSKTSLTWRRDSREQRKPTARRDRARHRGR